MSFFFKSGVNTYLKENKIFPNVFSGLVVGIVAIPLAMAFAIASGARPEHGLYTAIISGIIIAVFGGCKLQISGPTGAFIVILASINSKYGYNGLQIATIIAGIFLVIFGKLKFGAVIKFIPRTVIIGFTSGIAVLIFIGQWKDFFGLPVPVGDHLHEKLYALISSFHNFNFHTTTIGIVTLLILIISPKIIKIIPSPLVAITLATIFNLLFGFDDVQTIGSTFGPIPSSIPFPKIPYIEFNKIFLLIGPAFTIALLGSIESLLSAVVADGMTNTRHDSNKELVGQGLANILSPLFGGFASTGAIARTATNIKNGATSSISGIVHSAVVLFMVLYLGSAAAMIPIASLAAILFVVSYNMCEFHSFYNALKYAGKSESFILVLTFLLTIFTDLIIAVNIGVALSSLVFMHKMSTSVKIEYDEKTTRLIFDDSKSHVHHMNFTEKGQLGSYCDNHVISYTINGPFFFAAAGKIESVLSSINVPFEFLILRFGNVPFIDVTGVSAVMAIIKKLQRNGKVVVLCSVQPYVMEKFKKSGIIEQVGEKNIINNISDFKC